MRSRRCVRGASIRLPILISRVTAARRTSRGCAPSSLPRCARSPLLSSIRIRQEGDMSTNTNGNHEPSTPRISHVVLRTTRLGEMIEWYQTVFHAQVLYRSDFGAFLTYDEEHHRIALFAFPGLVEKPKRSTGLDHLAFFYATFGDWIENYERLKA